MSFQSVDNYKLTIKSSNFPGVARFSSTLDDAHVVFVANNCNNYLHNDTKNAGIIGSLSIANTDGNDYETYIAYKKDEVIYKIARFNSNSINLETNTIVS